MLEDERAGKTENDSEGHGDGELEEENGDSVEERADGDSVVAVELGEGPERGGREREEGDELQLRVTKDA